MAGRVARLAGAAGAPQAPRDRQFFVLARVPQPHGGVVAAGCRCAGCSRWCTHRLANVDPSNLHRPVAAPPVASFCLRQPTRRHPLVPRPERSGQSCPPRACVWCQGGAAAAASAIISCSCASALSLSLLRAWRSNAAHVLSRGHCSGTFGTPPQDATYIFPVVTAGTFLAMVEIGADGMQHSDQQVHALPVAPRAGGVQQQGQSPSVCPLGAKQKPSRAAREGSATPRKQLTPLHATASQAAGTTATCHRL